MSNPKHSSAKHVDSVFCKVIRSCCRDCGRRMLLSYVNLCACENVEGGDEL